MPTRLLDQLFLPDGGISCPRNGNGMSVSVKPDEVAFLGDTRGTENHDCVCLRPSRLHDRIDEPIFTVVLDVALTVDSSVLRRTQVLCIPDDVVVRTLACPIVRVGQ